MNNYLILEQTHVLSQNQIQSLEVLAMDSVTLNEFMNNEYLENPVLDRNHVSDTTIDRIAENIDHQTAAADAAAVYNGQVASGEETEYQIPDKKLDDVREMILGQLIESRYSSEERELIKFMIDSLDKSGYYDMTAEETAVVYGIDEQTAARCLHDLKGMEPCGIFTSGLEECLLRQLDHAGELDENLQKIVTDHLEDVASGKLKNITRALSISTVDARKYIEVIKRMNPRPLQGFDQGITEYAVPDIIVEPGKDGWIITLNDKWIEDYRISDYYRKMMEQTEDQELLAYFRSKMERARLLLKNVEQRRSTILRIAETVVDYQKDYFEGKGPLRPLTMQEVADRIDMHLSTVSRGIRGKYIQSKWGTVPLKSLFSQSVNAQNASGDTGMTAESVKKRIREIIESEDKTKPYSDMKIASLLENEEISISRRTVAKYREMLNIPGIFERKI
ncbi:MAG: RNA polymerase factor sigma-54 [Eubacteriales bacterium]|nr:RNA polymerase factor sigma-54 [Eubacteriales bacterium]